MLLKAASIDRWRRRLPTPEPLARGAVDIIVPDPPFASDVGPWREVELVALDFAWAETEAAPRVTAVALVPVRHGRIIVGGLRRLPVGDHVPHAVADALGHVYVITWSPTVDRTLLSRACGDGPGGWRRRSLDLYRLAQAVDESRGGTVELVSHGLADVAQRCHVPAPQPLDVEDGALTIAQLFLVLATRLETIGCRNVGALLRIGGYSS